MKPYVNHVGFFLASVWFVDKVLWKKSSSVIDIGIAHPPREAGEVTVFSVPVPAKPTEVEEVEPDPEAVAAVAQVDIVPENFQSDVDRQITAVEYRALLSALVNSLRPDNTDWFEENVSTYDKPLLRGEGFVMAYYAAECVGANVMNNGWFDHSKVTGDDFWNTEIYELDKLFPHIWDGPVQYLTGEVTVLTETSYRSLGFRRTTR
jgi:hypothetical protein